MKRQYKTLIIVLVILALLVAAYFVVQYINQKNEELAAAEEEAGKLLVPSPAGELTAFTYEFEGESNSFTLVDGVWTYDAAPDLPLTQSYPVNMADFITDMEATVLVETGRANFASYGLDQPIITIKAGGYEYLVGARNTVTTDYYIYSVSDDTVYTVDYAVYYRFNMKLMALCEDVTVPSIAKEDITRLALTDNTTGEVTELTLDENADALARGLYFGEKVAWAPENADRAEFGLSEPKYSFTVEYTDAATGEPASYTLYFGSYDPMRDEYTPVSEEEDAETELTQYIYCMTDYSNFVMLLQDSLVSLVLPGYIPGTEA